jgi:hypothetical protein
MLGLRLRPLVHVAVGSGALALTGCPGGGGDTETDTDTDGTGTSDTDEPTTSAPTTVSPPTTVDPTTDPPPPGDVTPPQLVAVEFLDPQLLRLTFTEAIAPVDDVNPLRFRLSLAAYRPAYYYSEPRTTYVDPDQFNADQVCKEVCYGDDDVYYCYDQCYYGPQLPLNIADILPDAYNPAQAIVLLAQPVLGRVCQIAGDIGLGPEGSRGGLFLHYASGGAAQITDLAGLPLASIGDEWVKTDLDYMDIYGANFPAMNPFLPIPCPF